MKTKYDWSNVPKEVNWIATDKNGTKCQFKSKPTISVIGWRPTHIDDLCECVFDAAYADNWKDSLEERPKCF